MARKKISNEPLKPPDISDPLFPYGPKNKHLQGVLGIRKDAKKRGGDTYQTPVSLEEEYEKEIQETIAEINAAHNIINSDDESKVRLSKRYNESKNIVEEELEKIEEQFRSASEIAETSKTESDILNNKELDWLEENKILTEAPHVDYSEFPELAVFDPTNSGVLDFSLELLPPRLFQRYRRGFNFFYNGKRYYVSTKSSVIEPFDPAKDTWKRPVFDEWQDYVNIRDRYVPKYNTIKVSTNSAKKRKLIIKINETK